MLIIISILLLAIAINLQCIVKQLRDIGVDTARTSACMVKLVQNAKKI
jgi:hypothetical protein